MSKSDETQKRILELAKIEFLDKGFKDASARNIAKIGNITTGAIYRYFPSNESLFSALVEPAATMLHDYYSTTQQNVQSVTPQQRGESIASDNGENLLKMLDFIYEHLDAFRLIVCCSEGTQYERYIDRMADISVENTYGFIRALREDGMAIPDVSDYAIRTLCRNTLTAVFDVVAQKIPREHAVTYIKEVFVFYDHGWKALLGL